MAMLQPQRKILPSDHKYLHTSSKTDRPSHSRPTGLQSGGYTLSSPLDNLDFSYSTHGPICPLFLAGVYSPARIEFRELLARR